MARELEVEFYLLQLSILRLERALALLRTSPRFNDAQIRVRTAALAVERRRLEETALALGEAMEREERWLVWWNAMTAVSHNIPSLTTFSKYIHTCSVGRAASAPTRCRGARTQEGSGPMGKQGAVEGGGRTTTIMGWREAGAVEGFALIVVIYETDSIAKLAVKTPICDLYKCPKVFSID